MRSRLAAAWALALVAAPALADSAAPTPPPRPNARFAMFPMQGGEAIYKGVCQGCHMPDAKGRSAPACIRRLPATPSWKKPAIRWG